MKKLIGILMLAGVLVAGCNLSDTSKVKDTFVKVYNVVGQTIPVLQELEKLDYIKPEVKTKIVMVVDGLALVYDKIGSIAKMLGIDLTSPVVTPTEATPAPATDPVVKAVADPSVKLGQLIEELKK